MTTMARHLPLHAVGRGTLRLLAALATAALAACASLPTERSTATSQALTGTADTRLGVFATRAVADLRAPSGVHLLYQGPDGRSRAALHAKTLVVDSWLFLVGSMNLDPRSAFTNTEIGIVVDAPAEAARPCGVLDDVLAHAYRVELRPAETRGSRIEWSDQP
jgi:phosphatidylserine/phosphatidylglycerophosphate/cardiolipin synthase-like enzyme